MAHEEQSEFEVEVLVNTQMPAIELSIGDNAICLSSEEAIQIAEALAEAASIVNDLPKNTGKSDAEPVDVIIHSAPERLQ